MVVASSFGVVLVARLDDSETLLLGDWVSKEDEACSDDENGGILDGGIFRRGCNDGFDILHVLDAESLIWCALALGTHLRIACEDVWAGFSLDAYGRRLLFVEGRLLSLNLALVRDNNRDTPARLSTDSRDGHNRLLRCRSNPSGVQ